jgi:hypothetical protein
MAKEFIMMAKALIRVLVLCALVGGASSMLAQPAGYTYNRLNVIEVFTSATCPPCAPAAGYLNEVSGLGNQVVTIRHHVNIPVPGDPWHVAYPEESTTRYGQLEAPGATSRSAPRGFINGNNDVNLLAGVAQIQQVVNVEKAEKSPCEITVNQTGTNVKVTVKTNIRLTGYTLRVALVSYKTVFTQQRASTIPNWNGETEFSDAFLKYLNGTSGSPVNIPQNSDDEFNFTYTPGTGELWPANQQYVIAFLQNDATREVIQAGTNLKEASVSLALDGAVYRKIAKVGSATRTITLTNPSPVPLAVTLSVRNSEDITRSGYTASINPATVNVPANGTATSTLNVSAPNRPWYTDIVVGASAVAPAEYFAKGSSTTTGYLSDGADVLVYNGLNSQIGSWSQGGLSSAKYGQLMAFVPLSDGTVTAYPPSEFKAIVLPGNFDGRGAIAQLSPFWLNLLSQGSKLWVSSAVDVTLSAPGQQLGGTSYGQQFFNFMTNTLGLAHRGAITRATQSGNQISISPWNITGTGGGPFSGASYDLNTNVSGSFPIFTQVSDALVLEPSAAAKAAATSSVSVQGGGNLTLADGVTYLTQNGGKLIYTVFGAEGIFDLQKRTGCIDKAIDWLLAEDGTPEIAVSAQTLNFGSVEVDASGTRSFNITNQGTGSLVVTSMTFTDRTPGSALMFGVVSKKPVAGDPIRIGAGESATVQVAFVPADVSPYEANLVIESNAGQQSVLLRGTGQPSSVETEAISESGALGITITGQHPVRTVGAVALRANGMATLEIVDVTGSVVATLFNGNVDGTETVTIPASILNSGSYTIVARTPSDRATMSLVIAK